MCSYLMCLEADIDLLQMDKHSNLGVFSWLAGLLFTIDSLSFSLSRTDFQIA